MEKILMIFMLLSGLAAFAQDSGEQQLTALSSRIFGWEVVGNMDSLGGILHEKFAVMSSAGVRQTKAQYLARLGSGNFLHKAIEVQETTATITDYTGLVMGKGKFTVAINGQESVLSLAYTEVFTRTDSGKPWMLLAIHASPLPAAAKK